MKRQRLLIQITAIVLPLFALMTAAVIWTVYNSTLAGFLEAQNDHIRETMSDISESFIFLSDEKEPEVKEWYMDQLKKADFDYSRELTDEELAISLSYEYEPHNLTYEWYSNMPDEKRRLFLQSNFYSLNNAVRDKIEKADVQSVFLMDLKEDRQGLVMFDCGKDGSRKIGEYFDLDLSDHKTLQDMIDSVSTEVVFEMTYGFPYGEGNYYIGYKPVIINNEVRAVLGVTYRWDDFRSSLTGTIHKALLIIIGGIGIVMAVLLIFLYRKAVKPVSRMEKAVLEYTGDKDSTKIVAKMFKVKVKNELGYLSDAISDLALEIEHYTKENIRIAGERERAEKELYKAEVQIMVSQIRPHFMYNALTSIAMMCELDPKTAKEATITFAKYLRSNMDSLKQTRPVPFEKELDHLKKYLYIEKLRFDDLLNIEYDVQATNFELPMLSIQPLVENAVKHGVGMKDDGGTVRISTRETDDAFEVIIEDDGVGFDVNAPKKDDGRSHVGMENTKRRLKEMCDADIIITSKVGEGTTARVIIPKKEGKANEDTVS